MYKVTDMYYTYPFYFVLLGLMPKAVDECKDHHFTSGCYTYINTKMPPAFYRV